MGMKLVKITYHLERAAAARADHDAGRPVNSGSRRYGSHLDRAAMHDDKAGAYLAAGLREYAGRSQKPASVYMRGWNKRRYAGGPGRGHQAGSTWTTTGGRGAGWSRKTEIPE
jgi:hypothetical protein